MSVNQSPTPADQLDKIARILARLDEAEKPDNMDLPGFRLHPAEGRPERSEEPADGFFL